MINQSLFTLCVILIHISVLVFVLFEYVSNISKNKTIPILLLNFLIGIVFVSFILLFGFRDYSIGADTLVYKLIYESFIFFHDKKNTDIGFEIYMYVFSWVGFRGFLLACAVAYILPLGVLFNKITKYRLYLFFGLISLFSFYSLGINILRQGIAISLSMLALYFYINQFKKKAFLFFILGFSFHSSVVLIPLFSWFAKHFLNLKKSLFIFIITSFLSVIGEKIIALFSKLPFFDSLYKNRLSIYSEGISDTFYQVGFRLDFYLFNLFFILLGLFFIKKLKFTDEKYVFIYKVYVLLSSVFILFFNLPYSDRTGVLSWMLIPYIQLPLICKSNKYRKLTIPFFILLNTCIFYFFIN